MSSVPFCFSSGDLTLLDATTGTPSVNTTNGPPNSAYSCNLSTSGDSIYIYNLNADGGNYCMVAFKIFFSSVSPSNDITFYYPGTTSTNNPYLILKTDGTIQIINGVTNPTSSKKVWTNDWIQFVFYDPRGAQNDTLRLWVNGDLWIDVDVNMNGAISPAGISFQYPTNGVSFRVSETIRKIESSSFLGSVNPYGYDVYEFMVSGTGFTTSGSALDSGSWSNTGEQPFSTTNKAVYSGSTMSGYALTNGSSKFGPVGKDFANKSPFAAAWYANAKRGTGSSSVHKFLYGNSSDGSNVADAALTTSDTWFKVQHSELTTLIPMLNESCIVGMDVSGAQDFNLNEYYINYAVTRPIPIYSPLYKRRPYQVRI